MTQPVLTGSEALTVRISALISLYAAFSVGFNPVALILALVIFWLLLER